MTDAVVDILILEDEPAHAEAIRRAFEASDLKAVVHVAGTLREYREAVTAHLPTIALVDLILPDGRAIDVLTFPPDAGPFPILVMTSFGNEQLAAAAIKAGALDYIVKSPEAFVSMPQTVLRALREWNALQEIKQAEAALAKEQSLLTALMDNVPDQVYFKDSNSRFIKISKSQAARFGLSDPAQAVGKTDFDIFAEEHARPAFEDEREIMKTGRPLVDIEEKETWPDGRRAWVSTTKVPLRDVQGRIIGTFGISRDITERKRAEEAVRTSEAQLSNALQMARAGHWAYDVDQDTFTFNDNFYRIFRTTAAEVGGYRMSSAEYARRFCHPDDIAVVGGETRAAIESADPNYNRQIEHRFLYADGEVGTITVRFFIIKDAHGRTVKTYGVNQDITERKQAEEHLHETLGRLRQAVESTIQVLGMTVEARDPYTSGHQQRVTFLAEAIAREMGLPPEKLEGLRMAGQVHDIGKISIPSEILSKPTKLTPNELKLVHTHARKGYEILKGVEFPWPLAEIVYQHHERMDGSGYPRGLKGEEILVEARILALADTVEAMASDRPYRPAPGIKRALEEVAKNSGGLYDADATRACLILFNKKGFSFPA